MALQTSITNALASIAADAMCAQANNGFFDIYDGAIPATANTAITSQVKLAGLTLAATAFAAAVNGVATANAIGGDASADASGTAAWFRVYASNHTTVLWQGSVGTSGCNLNLLTVTIVATQPVNITGYTFTAQKTE